MSAKLIKAVPGIPLACSIEIAISSPSGSALIVGIGVSLLEFRKLYRAGEQRNSQVEYHLRLCVSSLGLA